MTQIEIEDKLAERVQCIYARLAGFLFLWLIITGLGGVFMTSHILGPCLSSQRTGVGRGIPWRRWNRCWFSHATCL